MKKKRKKIAPNAPPTRSGQRQSDGRSDAHAVSRDCAPAFSNYAGDVPLGIDQICQSLLALTGGWPKCISGVLCYVENAKIRVLKDAAALFAWIGGYAQVEWRRGARAVGMDQFFERLHQREQYDWAETHPHFPPVPSVYYMTEPPEPEHNGKLDELLDCFLPKTPQDRELIRALVLTLFWGGPPGKRPQFVIAAREDDGPDAGRGSGKTALVQYVSELVGGCIDVDPHGDRGRILTCLLSPSSWGRRIALLDNLKSARFSNDLLEKMITSTEITGHRLYHGFAARPNLLTWVITVNGAFFSTDEARRSVVIWLERPPDTPHDWDAETLAFIRENREAIVADVRWHLEIKKAATLTKIDRWGPWDLAVLNRCRKPKALLLHLGRQRDLIDADKDEVATAMDHLRSCIDTCLKEQHPMGHSDDSVDRSVVFAPTAWYVQALRVLKRDVTERQAQQFLVRLCSSGRLRGHRTNTQRGYLWFGERVDREESYVVTYIEYRPQVGGFRSAGRAGR